MKPGVYTIAIFADDPRNDATLHIDQYSGKVLVDVRWQDYGPVAKTVETGVMLHMGKLYGWPHQLVMLLICLMILASSVSGLWIWWSRRPSGRLAAPPCPPSCLPWAVPSRCWSCSGSASRWWGLHGRHLAAGQSLLLSPHGRGPGKLIQGKHASCTRGLPVGAPSSHHLAPSFAWRHALLAIITSV